MKDKQKNKIEQVKEFRVALDKEALWAELEARQKKEKRGGFIWFFPGLLLIAGLLFWVLYPNKISNNQNSELSSISDSKSTTELNKVTTKLAISEQAISDETSLLSRPLNQDSKLTTETKVSATKVKSTKSIVQTQVDPPVHNSNDKNINNNKNIRTDNSNLRSIRKEGLLQSTQQQKIDEVASSISTKDAPTLDRAKIAQDILGKDFLVTLFSIQKIHATSIIVETRPVKQIALSVFDFDSDKMEGHKSKIHLGKTYLELQAGVGFISRDLSDATDPNSNYPSIRTTTEAPLEAINFSFKYGQNLGKGFYASAGLEYHQINENFSYSLPTLETLETMENVITDIFINAEGRRFETRGQGQGVSRWHIVYSFYNRLRSYSVPLHLGYRLLLNRWSLSIEAGTHLNLAFNFNGTILDSDLQLTSNPSYYRDRVGLLWSSGIQIGYAIHKNWSVFMNPTFRTIPNLIDKNQSNLNQSYRQLSLDLGLRYTMKN